MRGGFSLRRRLGVQKHRRRQRRFTRLQRPPNSLFRFAHARTANSKRLGMVATNALRPLWMESPNVESFQPRFLSIRSRGLLRRTRRQILIGDEVLRRPRYRCLKSSHRRLHLRVVDGFSRGGHEYGETSKPLTTNDAKRGRIVFISFIQNGCSL